MKKYLFFLIFVSIARLFYGQERYTIQGELPDHSLDNSYLRLINSSALSQEKERIKHSFIDSILVVDGKFYYEGKLSQKPFLAHLRSAKSGRKMLNGGTSFIVEPGTIHIRIANWADEGVVSGTPINEDYSRYMIGKKKSKKNQLLFLEKYAQYPDVVRFHLSFWLKGRRASKNPDFPKYLQILERMPKADRDILLAWRDYTVKKEEYSEKTKPLLDSIRNNAPRFIETVPGNSSSTVMNILKSKNYKIYVDTYISSYRDHHKQLNYVDSIVIKNDSVFSDLLYLEESDIPYSNRGNELRFQVPLKEYMMDIDKKGNVHISFSARTKVDKFNFKIIVYVDGRAIVNVYMLHHQSVSFLGELTMNLTENNYLCNGLP